MNVSFSVLRRLPVYLHYLKHLPICTTHISATTLAGGLGFGDVQVRKDLASVSGEGKPRTGYDVQNLIDALETALGYKNQNNAVIVGAGKLGRALLDYQGFAEYGLHIVAAFDNSMPRVGVTDSGKYIYPMFDFNDFLKQVKVKIGIITVPAAEAQKVCDMMCQNGIRAIWNFAPTHLSVPDGVFVQHENMAASLACLSSHLAD